MDQIRMAMEQHGMEMSPEDHDCDICRICRTEVDINDPDSHVVIEEDKDHRVIVCTACFLYQAAILEKKMTE